MENKHKYSLFIWGGISGIIGTLCYIAAVTIPMNQIITYLTAMAWPILSIIFVFSLYRYIALESQSGFNQLAFVMACMAFGMVSMMISIQLAVQYGLEEYNIASSKDEMEMFETLRKSIRLVDMGLDVSWDLFIGVSLLFLSFAMRKNKSFGLWWSLASVVLGVCLIVLNVVTFPFPPNTRGLIDIGPVIGLFIIILSARLVLLGVKMKKLSN